MWGSKKKDAGKVIERMPQAEPSSGGYRFTDQTWLSEQRGLVWEFIKQAVGNLLTGNVDMTKISLPVTIFEPRSYLERLSDGWCYAPHYLTRAAAIRDDPVERLRLVVTFALAGLSNTCNERKPFNPILGETFQAGFDDGTEIFCEQSSHHPPVTNWQVLGPAGAWKFYGYGEWSASIRANYIKGHQNGPHFVEFASDGAVVSYQLPEVWMQGIMWGEGVLNYAGTLKFVDDKNGLCCEIAIPPAAEGGWFSSWGSAKPPADYLRGELYRVGAAGAKGEVLSRCEGSWLGSIEFDGKPYWSFKDEIKRHKPIPVADPLPSDCRHRADLVALVGGNLEQAGAAKTTLENAQRRDAKLRKDAGKGH